MSKVSRYGIKSLDFSKICNPLLDKYGPMSINYPILAKFQPYLQSYQKRNAQNEAAKRHMICLKDWNKGMIDAVLNTALNLKNLCQEDSHGKKMHMLPAIKVMILEDHCAPILRMAASKAASLLGADDVQIVTKIHWDHYYYGRIYSEMADVILVTTETHGCIRRFIHQSVVPVVCMKSRKHACVQSLATIMSIMEEYGDLKSLNMAYVGTPHQVLNDYLILCPLLGANLKFKCCCNKCPVSPLLFQDCKDMCAKLQCKVKQVSDTSKALKDMTVLIAGPATKRKRLLKEFKLSVEDIQSLTQCDWTFYHTCPWGKEVEDKLFKHENARTYNAFRNTQYIAAALIMFSLMKEKSFVV